MTQFKHRPLLILLLIFVSLSLYYSLVLPLGEASDETHHFALVRFIAERGRPPLTAAERAAVGPKGDASPIYHGLVALLTQHVDISDLPQLLDAQGRPERFIPADRRLTGQFLHTEDELFPFRGIVLAWHLARLPSILLGAATVLAVYLTALAIYPQDRSFALAAAGLAAFLPRFVISSAVVNDDNLALPLITFTLYVMIRLIQGDERRRVFIMLGVLIGLAAITKYHSLILWLELGLLLPVLGWRRRWGWPQLMRYGGWSLLAFSFVSGWWFIFLISRFNEVAARGWLGGLIAPLGDPIFTGGFDGGPFDFGSSNQPAAGLDWFAWLALLFQTFWIEYGGLNVLAARPIYLLLGLLVLLAITGTLKGVVTSLRCTTNNEKLEGWRVRKLGSSNLQTFKPFNLQTIFIGALPSKFKLWPPAAALLAFHFLLYFSLVAARYLAFPWPETAQGRHLYPALASIAFWGGWGLRQWWPERLQDNRRVVLLRRGLMVGLSGTWLALAIFTPASIILPVYQPYLPITTVDDIPMSHRLKVNFGPGIDLIGFDLHPAAAGAPLPLTLYWQTGTGHKQDYLIQVCLQDEQEQLVTCWAGHPVNGRYPVRAWEEGYLIRDEIYLPTPRCLLPGDYGLTLSVLPLRPDRATTTIDETAARQPPFFLDSVRLSASPQQSAESFEIRTGNLSHRPGKLALAQIRQALTVIIYEANDDLSKGGPRPVELAAVDKIAAGNSWRPVASGQVYTCVDGSLVAVHHFIVDASVKPGNYRLKLDKEIQLEPAISVQTRRRNFTAPVNLPVEANISFGGEMRLLGYEVDLSPRWPGDTVRLKSYWQAQRQLGRNYVAILKLLDSNFTAWSQVEPVMGGNYPTVLWAPDETVENVYDLRIGRQVPAGLYTLEFSVLYDYLAGAFYFLPAAGPAGTGPVEHLYIGPLRVLDPATHTPPQHLKPARLGDQIELLGYDLNSEKVEAGRPLQVVLHWQAIDRPRMDYTVFVQLIGPDGLVKAQQDNQPQAGRYPTSHWPAQDKVVDRYTLSLAKETPPGDYRLLVGMYDLATGQRLPAVDESGQRLPDDAVVLTTLRLD